MQSATLGLSSVNKIFVYKGCRFTPKEVQHVNQHIAEDKEFTRFLRDETTKPRKEKRDKGTFQVAWCRTAAARAAPVTAASMEAAANPPPALRLPPHKRTCWATESKEDRIWWRRGRSGPFESRWSWEGVMEEGRGREGTRRVATRGCAFLGERGGPRDLLKSWESRPQAARQEWKHASNDPDLQSGTWIRSNLNIFPVRALSEEPWGLGEGRGGGQARYTTMERGAGKGRGDATVCNHLGLELGVRCGYGKRDVGRGM